MNDSEREEWVRNDEGLYRWWRSSRQPLRTFVRENRDDLTRIIQAGRDCPPGKSYYQVMGEAMYERRGN